MYDEYSDEYEIYGYQELEQEYFDSYPQIYSQEAIDAYVDTAIREGWIQ